MSFDPTTHLARNERLGDPVLQSAWAGTEARVHLEELDKQWQEARRKRDQIASFKRRELMPLDDKIQRMRSAIEGLRELINRVEHDKASIEARYLKAYEDAEDECMRIEKELFTERHRLRFMSELSEQCVKIAGEV